MLRAAAGRRRERSFLVASLRRQTTGLGVVDQSTETLHRVGGDGCAIGGGRVGEDPPAFGAWSVPHSVTQSRRLQGEVRLQTGEPRPKLEAGHYVCA